MTKLLNIVETLLSQLRKNSKTKIVNIYHSIIQQAHFFFTAYRINKRFLRVIIIRDQRSFYT